MRVLKKYPNRRIYDTESSKFVALAEIRQMITDRESIQVLHSKTGEDLTRSVLMQVITEMEQEGHASLLTNRVLEELIRFYGDKIVAMMGPYLEQQILQSLASQDQIREHLTKAFTQPYPTPEQAIKSMIEQYQVFTGQTPPPGDTPSGDTPSGEAPTDDAVDDELGDKK
jgi:polyhydroxyalkanoate synthesis repressor PhaR